MKPYYQDEAVTLYNADALDGLRTLESDSVDLICTSPPYNCRKQYGNFDDQVAWSDFYAYLRLVLDECYRVLVRGGTIAVNVPSVIRWQAQHRFANTWSDFDPNYKTHRDGEKVVGRGRIEPLGFNVFEMMRQIDPHMREPVIWIKGPEGQAITTEYKMGCDSDPYMRPAHEFILLGSKGQWFHRGGTGRRGKAAMPFLDETKDVWFIPPQSDRRHPAVFPIDLPSRLIALFVHAADAVICDPFCGRGTTLNAASQAGYRSIGIEREIEYCDITAAHSSQSVLSFETVQGDPLRDRPEDTVNVVAGNETGLLFQGLNPTTLQGSCNSLEHPENQTK